MQIYMDDMADIILGDGAARKLKQVALSNDTITRRIKDLSIDIRDQLISDLKASPLKISIQLDESTDVSNCSQLICFVRYIKKKKVEEEFLFCQPLPRTTTAKNILKLVKEFLIKHNLDIKVIGSVCSDGAPAMLGNRSGFAAMLKEGIPELKITHCLLHRQALGFKTLPTCLKDTLNSCVKIVNYIRGRALNHLLFLSPCPDVNQNDKHVLLYHTEVRWLSRGRVLNRFLQLRKEIKRLGEKNLVVCFESVEFIQMTAYLADIFNHLNELNLSLQGKEINMVKASEKLKSFIAKLPLWSR